MGNGRGLVDKILKKRGYTRGDLKAVKKKRLNFPELNEVANAVIMDYILVESEDDSIKTGILYDVDVDGLFAGHILEDTLKRLGVRNVNNYINKYKEHGVQEQTVEWVINEGINWLFVVDAGSSDVDNINYLVREHGVRVVVIDHHPYDRQGKEMDSSVLFINIHDRPDLPQISGCGVVYRFVEKIAEMFSLDVRMYETYVGITTMSDMMDMSVAENRYYIKKAYEGYRQNLFLKKFRFYGSFRSFYGWQVIPYLNALIRVGHEKKAVRIVNNMDVPVEINRTPENVKSVKAKQGRMLEELREMSKIVENEHTVFCLRKNADERYKTVNGLVGNQLMKEYGKNALVLNYNSDTGLFQGSFRGKQVSKGDLQSYGMFAQGHDKACGVGATKEQLKRYKKESVFEPYEREKADLYVEESEMSKEDWMEIATFNEYTGIGIEPIVIGFKRVEYMGMRDEGYKKTIFLEKEEVVDFTGADDIEDIVVVPILNENSYQLVRD